MEITETIARKVIEVVDAGLVKGMGKARIVPKRDFGRYGFLIDGKWVKEGWIVTDGICNIMPGATWFQTIGEAIEAAGALHMARGDAGKFWNILRTTRAAA